MRSYLIIFQIVVSILLVLTILMQEKGVGLSATFGGGGEFYRSKRGVDRLLFIATAIFSILFIFIGIAFIFVK